jgi:2-polyprenyl-3-methyl-5-hydroxy-6-metoxy-1,4-benzoquinol methylase
MIELTSLYSEKSQVYYQAPRQEMLNFIPKDTKNKLEIGCGSGSFLKVIKDNRNCRITGIELNENSFYKAKTILDEGFHADATIIINDLDNKKYDCIIMNDVIEDIAYPEKLIPDGCIVASIPNLLFEKDWKYQESGVPDKTHLRFYLQKKHN